MKTPREILLERHQAAAPKLDAIRHEILKTELNEEGRRAAAPKFRVADMVTFPLLLWRELIFPSRRIWAGLAAIWILIFVFNFSQRDSSEHMAKRTSPPSPEMILAFRQQEELLDELIGPNEAPVAEPQKTFLPRPGSERRCEILVT